MILASLAAVALGVSLAVTVALEPRDAGQPEAGNPAALSLQQKRAVIRRLVNSANECIANTVTANPGYREAVKGGNVNDIIVDSVPPCLVPVRLMIDGYDRLFGGGAGETFFVGPYLDALPAAINRIVQGAAE
jgi:hypothetical protein